MIKKTFDKIKKPWYNMLYNEGNNVMTFSKLIEENSVDREMSRNNRDVIQNIGEAVRQVVNENFPGYRYPVIAGGAIRDTIFGLKIKDFDIFFDTTPFDQPDDTPEDIALLLIALICEKLGAHEYPKLRNCRFSAVGHNEGYELQEGMRPFVVYENYAYEEPAPDWIPGQNDEAQGLLGGELWPGADIVAGRINNEAIVRERPYSFPNLQLIGHKDDRLREDPVTFLEYFDYGLVRGLFDPSDHAFHVHPSLIETINSKTITVTNDKTYNRVYNFLGKFFRVPRGASVVDAYKVVDNRPKKATVADIPFDWKTTSSTLASYTQKMQQHALDRQFFAGDRWNIPRAGQADQWRIIN